jgi:hypothetical protein
MNVPEPPRATIELAPAASFEKTLFDAVSVSYDIAEDDARLRAKPSDFERLRGDYLCAGSSRPTPCLRAATWDGSPSRPSPNWVSRSSRERPPTWGKY